ncbi:uncharacterized protein si:ch211-217g15.3 [Plectropomus leopardus]|uniref:uncharacterized protein si:ch211-217g15.3 n=1 Tax=Plectropomus leopardus TaxID=160734 RepID=UPI001C4C16FD|nr:uncharacterized protein si:ch211-217g15.3 [Plectropomus leopardus]
MLRFSLAVFVSLILGITAKPYKPWNKLTDEGIQDAVMSVDDKGKMSWGVQVEPPEDMDETDYDIDPKMMIWKSMTGNGRDRQPLKAEEDFDELYHPSMADLLKVQIQNLDTLHAADIMGPWEEESVKSNQKPEEDKDDIDHPDFIEVASDEHKQNLDEVYNKAREEVDGYLAPLLADYKADAEIRVSHFEPERDDDELYHHSDQDSPVQMEPLSREVVGVREVRVHLQPEVDMDDLYHKEEDLLQLIPYQEDTEAAAPVYLPSERKHSEPEEDLDDLYHH